jgi:hypothetical protein
VKKNHYWSLPERVFISEKGPFSRELVKAKKSYPITHAEKQLGLQDVKRF